MNSEDDRPSSADSDHGLDAEIGRVFDAYLAEREAGRAVDPEQLCAEHPHLADRLRACLEVMDWADDAVDAPPGSSARTGFRGSDVADGSCAPYACDGELSSVLLRELPGEPVPMLRALPASLSAGRYRLLGEIARGGMGAVLKGHDAELGRELAVKILLRRHSRDPDIVRRFTEEAQIGGQLQHPGVVPVYDVGLLPDRRPFFAMKLVQGRTLAALLAERPSPDRDRARFVGIFEQVCQAVAYAHARGVIHRDLKPSNVMVGAFGEVQVMDWGLAKVLTQGGIADEGRSPDAQKDKVRIVRGASGSDPSQVGSVLGTPAYMAPQQARGEVGRLDERADVFSLGAILCEILTGAPPYGQGSPAELRATAACGDLSDAWQRIAACAGDKELCGLATDCLSVEPADRPRNAGEVAREVRAYASGVQERLRIAELSRATALARAESERIRRRLTVALAAAVVALVALGSGGSAYFQRQRSVRREAVAQAVHERLDQAAVKRGEAAAAPVGELSGWAVALAEVKGAEDLLRQGEPDRLLAARVAAVHADIERARAAAEGSARSAEAERRLVERLETIRGDQGDHWDPNRADREYAAAFREFGVDFDTMEPTQAGAMLAGRPASVEIAAALDDWCRIRRMDRAGGPNAVRWSELASAARIADPHEWRNALRALYGRPLKDVKKELQRLAADPDVLARQPADSLLSLVGLLQEAGEREESIIVLRRAWQQHPDDFWVNLELSRRGRETSLDVSVDESKEAARFATAAIAVRPSSPAAHSYLGVALRDKGDLDGAIAEFREAVRLKPDSAEAHSNYGMTHQDKGDVNGAIVEYREAIRLKPDFALAHSNLGNSLASRGDFSGAVAEYREAIRLKPDFAAAHSNYGDTLKQMGNLDGAIAEFREAIHLKPDMSLAHSNYGDALKAKGDLDGAIAEFREAVRLKPEFLIAHFNLGNTLKTKGDVDGAIAEFQQVLRLDPDSPRAHNSLGDALSAKGDLDGAIAEFRQAIRLKPDYSYPRNNLGNALRAKGDVDGAIAEYREALRVKPDYAMAHHNLANALFAKRDLDGAVAAYLEVLRLKPDDAMAHFDLGTTLSEKGETDRAIAEIRKAITLKPDMAQMHGNLGNALTAKGDLDGAIAAYREALRLKPDYAWAHYNLGNVLKAKGNAEGAIGEFQQAIRSKPDFAEAHCNLGHILRDRGEFRKALSELEKGHELGSKNPRWSYPSAQWVEECRRLVALDGRLLAVLKGTDRPADTSETVVLAQIATLRKHFAGASRLWSEAFAAGPKLAADMQAQHRYNAACVAALAAAGQGKDDPAPDEAARNKLRNQALDWLKADYQNWAKLLETGPKKARPQIAQTLRHWREDADLAGIRDPGALAALAEGQRKAFQVLWDEVEELLKRAERRAP